MIHFQILQANINTPDGAAIMFNNYDRIMKEGKKLSLKAYNMVYEGEFEKNTSSKLPVTEQIYTMFNIARPKDFKGHSLSVSDIIIVNGTCFFCDSYCFKEITLSESQKQNTTRKIYDEVTDILKEGQLSGEIEVADNGTVSVLIEWGDWKHEHGCLCYLMHQKGFTQYNEVVTEEDGSDCYSSIHYFKKKN